MSGKGESHLAVWHKDHEAQGCVVYGEHDLAGCGKTRLMTKIWLEFPVRAEARITSGCSKRPDFSPAQAPARQDAPFRRQGRSERRGEEVPTALRGAVRPYT